MREIDGMMVSGYYCRLFPIVSGYSIPLDWLRNLRLIKIVDSPAQLTVTRWKLISSHPTSHSLHRSRILRGCRPESNEHGTIVSSGVSISEIVFGYPFRSKRLYRWTRETIYLAFARNAAVAAAAAATATTATNGSDWPRRTSAESDVHFMGRHVVSVQWCKVWFFPGNFGLFNRDPISDLSGLPPLRFRCSLLRAILTLLAFSSNRSSLFRFAFSFSLPLYLSLLHFVITSLVLLRAALFRLILSRYFLSLSRVRHLKLSSSIPSTSRKWHDCLSASLASTLIDITFCLSCSLLRVIRLTRTRINRRHTAVCLLVNKIHLRRFGTNFCADN